MAISTPMLVTFCVYIFGMILIGFIAWHQRKTLTTIFWAVVAWAIRDGIIGGCVGYERLAVNGVAGRGFSFRDFRKLDRHWPDIRRVDQLEAGGRAVACAYRIQQ